jgi:putative endonuclease
MSDWFLYVIETSGGHLYTGITTDVARRLAEHETGKGAKFLRGKTPLALRCQYAAGNRSLASKLEARVKSLSKTDKLRLIQQPDLFTDMINELESTSSGNS